MHNSDDTESNKPFQLSDLKPSAGLHIAAGAEINRSMQDIAQEITRVSKHFIRSTWAQRRAFLGAHLPAEPGTCLASLPAVWTSVENRRVYRQIVFLASSEQLKDIPPTDPAAYVQDRFPCAVIRFEIETIGIVPPMGFQPK